MREPLDFYWWLKLEKKMFRNRQGLILNDSIRGTLNSVLVNLFNDILNIEEKALITGEFTDISVNDMHIIEAIGVTEERKMSQIAKSLDVTMGTLTIGINGLVKKGYVVRHRSEEDRRVVYAFLTDKGRRAYDQHMKFHKDMVEAVMIGIDEDEAKVLTSTLVKLSNFFEKLK